MEHVQCHFSKSLLETYIGTQLLGALVLHDFLNSVQKWFQ